MGDISKHFNRSEFACKCGCNSDNVDIEILEWAELIREHYKKPVHVHCGNRCLTHNRSIGSEDTSQHIKFKAFDFHIDGEDPEEIACWINDNLCPDSGGIGIYSWGVHLDRRDSRARWDNRT